MGGRQVFAAAYNVVHQQSQRCCKRENFSLFGSLLTFFQSVDNVESVLHTSFLGPFLEKAGPQIFMLGPF